MSESGRSSFDMPSPEAEQRDIARVAGIILVRIEAEGENTPGAIAKRQLELIVADGDNKEVAINLYSDFEDEPEMVCTAEVNVDLDNDDIQQIVEYRFSASDGKYSVEKYSHIYDISKARKQIALFFKGSLDVQKAVLEEMQIEDREIIKAQKLTQEVGLQITSGQEIAELEDLVLRARALKF